MKILQLVLMRFCDRWEDLSIVKLWTFMLKKAPGCNVIQCLIQANLSYEAIDQSIMDEGLSISNWFRELFSEYFIVQVVSSGS